MSFWLFFFCEFWRFDFSMTFLTFLLLWLLTFWLFHDFFKFSLLWLLTFWLFDFLDSFVVTFWLFYDFLTFYWLFLFLIFFSKLYEIQLSDISLDFLRSCLFYPGRDLPDFTINSQTNCCQLFFLHTFNSIVGQEK